MGDLPRYLDGPKFVKWLETEEGIKFSDLTDSQQRRWRDWEAGSRADLYGTADRILTDNHILSCLIPDDCWSDNQARYNSERTKIPRAQVEARRAEGRMLIAAGLPIAEICERLGVSPTTVRNWTRQMKQNQALVA
jgi:hypothetical protein